MIIESLLEPITPEHPAGQDLSGSSLWAAIAESRRRGSPASLAVAGRDPEAHDWSLVEQLTRSALQKQSKDIRIAIWWLEAQLHLRAMEGLCEGLQLLREMLERFWDQGLHPDEDFEMRTGMLEWLDKKLADALLTVVLAVTSDGESYTYGHLLDLQSAEGERDVLLEALSLPGLSPYEVVADQAVSAIEYLHGIGAWLGDRVADVVTFSESVARLQAMSAHLRAWSLNYRRRSDADVPSVIRPAAEPSAASPSGEPVSGRDLFLRHLELAENCVREDKLAVARGILQALGEQADRLGLEQWESPLLLARVWKLLHASCEGAHPGSCEATLRAKAFHALCRSAPREALDLGCGK